MTGTVNESGSESFSYNYTGTPILGADGEWSWSGGSGTAGGSGNATWTKAGSGPYSRTEGYGESSYPIHGTKTEYVAESASYSYSTTAFVVGDVWIVSGSGNNAAQGVSTTGYSGSGSYSSTTTSGGSTVTLDNTTSESGGATESYQASLNFTLSDGLWEATNGSASSYQGWTSNLGQTSTRGETENSNWGDPSNGGNRSAMSLLCRTAQGTSAFGRTETYTWNPGAASGSGSGSGSGSASGSASPWQFTGATETAGAGLSLSLNYAYSGSGASWHLDDEGPEISASYADWHSTRLITQSSLSAFGRTLNTAPGSGGEFETTGTETHAVAASGSADATGDSQWDGMWCWDGITWGRSEASGSTYRETTHDDYDYGCSRAITYHADGTSTSSGGPSNDVSGTLSSSSEGWWEWSEWWTEGSGSGSGSGGGGSSSSNGSSSGSWSQSYSHAVGYPGFYEGAYYGSSPEWGGRRSGRSARVHRRRLHRRRRRVRILLLGNGRTRRRHDDGPGPRPRHVGPRCRRARGQGRRRRGGRSRIGPSRRLALGVSGRRLGRDGYNAGWRKQVRAAQLVGGRQVVRREFLGWCVDMEGYSECPGERAPGRRPCWGGVRRLHRGLGRRPTGPTPASRQSEGRQCECTTTGASPRRVDHEDHAEYRRGRSSGASGLGFVCGRKR